MRVSTRAKNPERYKDTDETSKMQAEHHTLNERKMLGEEGIENGDKNHNGDREESSVPSLENVVVVVEDDKALNFGCCQKAPN